MEDTLYTFAERREARTVVLGESRGKTWSLQLIRAGFLAEVAWEGPGRRSRREDHMSLSHVRG